MKLIINSRKNNIEFEYNDKLWAEICTGEESKNKTLPTYLNANGFLWTTIQSCVNILKNYEHIYLSGLTPNEFQMTELNFDNSLELYRLTNMWNLDKFNDIIFEWIIKRCINNLNVSDLYQINQFHILAEWLCVIKVQCGLPEYDFLIKQIHKNFKLTYGYMFIGYKLKQQCCNIDKPFTCFVYWIWLTPLVSHVQTDFQAALKWSQLHSLGTKHALYNNKDQFRAKLKMIDKLNLIEKIQQQIPNTYLGGSGIVNCLFKSRSIQNPIINIFILTIDHLTKILQMLVKERENFNLELSDDNKNANCSFPISNIYLRIQVVPQFNFDIDSICYDGFDLYIHPQLVWRFANNQDYLPVPSLIKLKTKSISELNIY